MARLGRGGAAAAASVLLALGVLLATPNVATAATIEVGGGSGTWGIPTTVNIDYQTWADGQSFTFGDELVFNYQNNTHDVFLLNSTAFAACDTTDDPISKWDSGEDVIELSQLSQLTPGSKFYFVCGFPGHCAAGQKFHITVSAYVPPPVGSTTPTTESPPGGSAPPLQHIGGLMLAIAMVFCTTFLW